MKSLGFIMNSIKEKGKCRLFIHIHNLSLEETNLLHKKLGKGFSRKGIGYPKYSPPYICTNFNGYEVLGYEAIHISTYRDTITKEKGGE